MASLGSERHDKKWRGLCDSLHEPPPLPTLPSDVIPEILCRLPVKVIYQFRCICKSWNSLISDPKFDKQQQLRMINTRNLHFLNFDYDSGKYILTSYPLESVFTNITSNFTQSEYSSNHFTRDCPIYKNFSIIGSCNGIVCIADNHKGLVILWNPSTREFKELPLFDFDLSYATDMTFGFGYDSLKDNYKVVVVLNYWNDFENEVEEVKVHTLGTNIWRTIHQYPFGGIPFGSMKGEFVSGRINWLFSKELSGYPLFIVSFDLAKESYQKISPPNLGGVDVCDLSTLGVLRDCLCMVTFGHDVWIMKEYGNKESWTKLFNIPYMRDPSNPRVFAMPIYMFENDQILLKFLGEGQYDSTLVLYDPTSSAFKDTNFKKIPEVCGESLISPHFPNLKISIKT